MKQYIINHFHISGNYIAGDYIDIHDNPSSAFCHGQHIPVSATRFATAEEVAPIDTSFFCTLLFSEDIIVKNLRQVISLATSKADACRRIMALEPQGYILLSNVPDDRKAELINPFSMPKFTFTAEDFKKARNR